MSFAPKLAPDDARVDWKLPGHLIDRAIRACTPEPGALDRIRQGKDADFPRNAPGPCSAPSLAPGELRVEPGRCACRNRLATGTPRRCPAPGKRRMPAADWAWPAWRRWRGVARVHLMAGDRRGASAGRAVTPRRATGDRRRLITASHAGRNRLTGTQARLITARGAKRNRPGRRVSQADHGSLPEHGAPAASGSGLTQRAWPPSTFWTRWTAGRLTPTCCCPGCWPTGASPAGTRRWRPSCLRHAARPGNLRRGARRLQ